MNPEMLIGSLIRGAFASRGRRSRKAIGFLTGGRSAFLNTSTLLTAAGVVWGLIESSAGSQEQSPKRPESAVSGPVPAPPPIPRDPAEDAGRAADEEVPEPLLRLVRLTVSAARADGNMSREETDLILSHASRAGAAAWVEREVRNPKPLSEIASGINDPKVKADMYTLGYVIVRADEGISGAERIYLAQLANHLGLDREEASRLEREADAGIERE